MKKNLCRGFLIGCLCFVLLGCKQEDAIIEEVTELPEALEIPELAEEEQSQDVFIMNPEVPKMDVVIESEQYYCISDGEKWGYMSREGEALTSFRYDEAYPFSEGLACVSVNGKYGFVDTNGKEVIPLIYDDAAPYSEGLAYFVKDGVYGFMDQSGNPVFYPECDSISSFSEGLAYFSVDGKYGYMDKRGEVVLEPIYDDAGYMEDGQAIVSIGSKYGVIDKNGEEVLPIVYDYVAVDDDGFRIINGEEDYYVDADGKRLPEQTMNDTTVEIPGKGQIVERETGYGVVDLQGKEVLLPEYDAIDYYDTTEGVVLVLEKENVQTVVLWDGLEEVLTVREASVQVLENGAITCQKNDEKKLYNPSGKLIYTTGEYCMIWTYNDGYCVEEESSWRFVFLDAEGKKEKTISGKYYSDSVYGNSNAKILSLDEEVENALLVLGDPQNYDEKNIRDIILQNKITPEKEWFWQLTRPGEKEDYVDCDKHCFRYYKIDDSLMLYHYAEPYDMLGFALSESELYVYDGQNAVKILDASECGGSAGGNYICFWTDTEMDEVMIGTYGHAGGFGGSAIDGVVCRYRDGVADEVFSYMYISQTIYNYEEEELLQNAHLFYDEDGNPCTSETILQEEYITEYIINGETVTKEAYHKAREGYQTCYRTLE